MTGERRGASLKPRWRNPLLVWPGTQNRFRNDHQRNHFNNSELATLSINKGSRWGSITMAEQMLDQAREVFEGQIVGAFRSFSAQQHLHAATNTRPQDFEGQKLVELLVNVALTLVGVSHLQFCLQPT